MTNYEINKQTFALLPINANQTKILENDNTIIVDKSVNKIMEESCEFFGSSLIGRQKGTKKLINVTHKAPIIVEETNDIIFFPTSSPRLETCAWLSLKNIKSYYKDKNKIIIVFKNDKKIELNLTFGIIDNQVLRSARLESVLRDRKVQKTFNF